MGLFGGLSGLLIYADPGVTSDTIAFSFAFFLSLIMNFIIHKTWFPLSPTSQLMKIFCFAFNSIASKKYSE